MEAAPLVTVICLCYNHELYVEEAIRSVEAQDYPYVELIVVDDASSDHSLDRIQATLPSLRIPHELVCLEQNLGNCRAFNQALALAKGKYIIDLAADDILEPNRIRIGVGVLEKSAKDYGVHYCLAQYIDENCDPIALETRPIPEPHEGDIYQTLITQYWINPASMMMKKACLDQLGGYNESLSYEDFDFWIRSSRDWKYAFTAQQLVRKRELKSSLGKGQQHWRNKHQPSTLEVCKTIQMLNRSKEENDALRKRISYEMRQCLRTGNIELLIPYYKLIRSII